MPAGEYRYSPGFIYPSPARIDAGRAAAGGRPSRGVLIRLLSHAAPGHKRRKKCCGAKVLPLSGII